MPEKPTFFDRNAAEQALGALTTRINDADFGQGDLLMTGGGQTLEVFADAVRITAPDMKVEITGQPLQADIGPDWVLFRGTADGMTRIAALRATGEINAKRTAAPEVYRAQQAEEERAVTADAARAPETPADAALPAPAAESGKERGQLVSFTGRIGRDPKVARTEQDVTVKLAIAEHRAADDGAERTVWHEVWPSKNIAPKVADQAENGVLVQGVEVSIRGYQHRHKPTGNQREGKPFVRAFRISPVKGQRSKP